MPAPILDRAGWADIERTAVALQSIRAAADAHRPAAITDAERWYRAVAKYARRHTWPVGRAHNVTIAREHRKTVALTVATAAQSTAQAVSSPVYRTPSTTDALDTERQERARRTRDNLSRGIERGSRHVESLDGAEVLSSARHVESLSRAAGAVDGWEASESGGGIKLSLTLIAQASGAGREKPPIDV